MSVPTPEQIRELGDVFADGVRKGIEKELGTKEEKTTNKVGRPLKYKTVEEMQELIDAYFEDRIAKKKPFTITGLAIALDTSRETLMEYEGREKFADTIKRAKQRCENYAEEYLFEGKNQTGAIFALKNYGWKDKTETDHTTGGQPMNVSFLGIPQQQSNQE